MSYDNNMSGVLFKNDRKTTDKHPDYQGSCEIEGEEYWISAWIKEGQKGKFMSLAFKSKDEKPKDRGNRGQTHEESHDNDPPF